MACPFFMPSERLDDGPWSHAPRLPLGDPYRGVCFSRPAEGPFEPSEGAQRDLCNCGYARGVCDRFPGGESADAVRFSVTSCQGGCVDLVYVFERNHTPQRHGLIQFPETGTGLLARQADAFVKSYLRRIELR